MRYKCEIYVRYKSSFHQCTHFINQISLWNLLYVRYKCEIYVWSDSIINYGLIEYGAVVIAFVQCCGCFSCWYRCSFWLESICEWLVWNPCPFVFAKLVFMDEYYNCKLSHVPHSMLTLNYMDMNYCWCWNCECLIECAHL